jgi:hypothetical protein
LNHPGQTRFRCADESLGVEFPDEFIAGNTANRIFSGEIMAQFGSQNGFIFV